MTLQLMKSKIHKARITMADLHYEGSLAIDMDIADAAGLYPYEKILVVNITNGERLETYIIPAPRGSKEFCLNGAAAHRGSKGDVITIMAFANVDEADAATLEPKVLILDENNEIVETKGRIDV